ncbi:MAG TPA: hypothetical protein VMW56_08665 [Candidatus Margulisiibacteriota bacterium]|nr:hypothetical protein [Candidatus Margulisiibacteriota bacterium]
MPWTVIPANAGIQIFRMLVDPRFRGGDDGDQFFNGLLAPLRVRPCPAMLCRMSVEFVPAAHVREVTRRVADARQHALDRCGAAPPHPDTSYWQALFEANAAEVLAVLPAITLPGGFVVRYRFFEQRGRDLLVRPFVARASTDVEGVRQLIDWHPPPDSLASAQTGSPTQDVALLYRHFSFPHTAIGVFEYWLAMQELWASQRWAHSHVIASATDLSQITAGEGWEVVHPVEAYEPAVVLSDDSARLAVLLQCPLGRFEITLQQIEIASDQSLHYGEPVLVASGPRGYQA